MENSRDQYIRELESKLAGLPPLKEITVPPESMLTSKETISSARDVLIEQLKKNKVI